MSSSFYQKLIFSQRENKSLLCLGLDPDPFKSPDFFPNGTDTSALVAWGQYLIEQTLDLVCCYKPNIAFYEQFGAAGWTALKEIIGLVPSKVPVLLDCKRGDIGSTATAYARAVFEELKADAVTLSPYLGQDNIAPFTTYPDKTVFILCYTSNPSATHLQEFPNANNPLYLQVAKVAQTWGNTEQIGFVVGATQAEPLAKVRQVAPHNLILAPGVGAQGGDLAATLKAGLNKEETGLIVPVSRGILYSPNPRLAAQTLRDEINDIRTKLAQSTSQTLPPYQALITGLYDLGCIKFGDFTLASGVKSPYYVDLRQVVSSPTLFQQALTAYADKLASLSYDRIAGIPYAGLPIATGLALKLQKPLIYPRKEIKAHGTGQNIEGQFEAGEKVVVIEDVVTSGGSAIKGADVLKAANLVIEDIVVLLDREQGGSETVTQAGYRLHAVLNLSEVVEVLKDLNCLKAEELAVLS